ncbi:MAG TPA: Fe-S cluster assembly protein HesB [Streptosporangiaceae bacterium]|nr:Fe-S cluster assembly protein HesB [Streptosporangiaceae bacterium]
MLTLTEGAVQVIRTVTSQPQLPDETGIRIVAQDTAGSLSLSVTEGPQEGDQVVEADGARVFLESGAAMALDDKTLDAEIDDKGDVSFLIGQQPA